MKRSFKKIALLVVLSVFFVSCTDDLDTTPSIPTESPNALSALQGEWELVNSSQHLVNGYHTFQIVSEMAVQKLANGAIVRASEFQIINSSEGQRLVYGKNLITPGLNQKAPDFFINTKIISVSPDQLVLEGNGILTFKKSDPNN
tara:strand:- start:66 stop:500 length:435 start_codon:yes stop_codon:yes gene_type:complete